MYKSALKRTYVGTYLLHAAQLRMLVHRDEDNIE